MRPETYDADAFDAALIVERIGQAQFYVSDVARVLGLANGCSVWTYVKRGKVPAPDHYEPDFKPGRRGGNTYRAVWTPAQVAEALMQRR